MMFRFLTICYSICIDRCCLAARRRTDFRLPYIPRECKQKHPSLVFASTLHSSNGGKNKRKHNAVKFPGKSSKHHVFCFTTTGARFGCSWWTKFGCTKCQSHISRTAFRSRRHDVFFSLFANFNRKHPTGSVSLIKFLREWRTRWVGPNQSMSCISRLILLSLLVQKQWAILFSKSRTHSQRLMAVIGDERRLSWRHTGSCRAIHMLEFSH